MKRGLLFAIAAFLFVLVMPGLSMGAGWVLYDNFNSGVLNTSLWKVSGDPLTPVTIENGMAKFVLQSGQSNVWLLIAKSPERVRGIRAKVMIKGCTGDGRARLGGWIGKIDADEYVFNQIAFQPNGDWKFWGVMTKIDQYGQPSYYDMGRVNFAKPQQMIGDMFLLETVFYYPNAANYSVYGAGYGSYISSESASYSDINNLGIGVRSFAGDSCTAYFDDVYVLYANR